MSIVDPVVPVDPIDLTDVRHQIGDTVEHPQKTNTMQARFEAWAVNIHANSVAQSAAYDQVNDAYDELIEARDTYIAALNDQPNILPNHGTFLQAPAGMLDGIGGYGDNLAAFTMDGISILDDFNGSTLSSATEVDRWVHNSSDYGGTEPPQSALAQSFADKMGSASRFLPPFAVAQFTSGTGTNGIDYNGNYRFFITNNLGRIGVGSRVSLSFYFQPVTADAFIYGNNPDVWTQKYIDGSLISGTSGEGGGNWHRLVAGEIYHLCARATLPIETSLSSSIMDLVAAPGSANRIALPWIGHGDFQMQPHTRPIRSHGTFGQM